jgi:DNA-directed RNA polymerase subunit N (RpoN/RPB10)
MSKMDDFYGGDDVVLCGYTRDVGGPYVASTELPCHKCGKLVWISQDSMNTVLDKVNEKGGKLWIVCVDCMPDDFSERAEIGEEQKKVLKEHGLDIDEMCRKTGLSLGQLMERAIEFQRLRGGLQRAAKQPPLEPPTAPDKKGYI